MLCLPRSITPDLENLLQRECATLKVGGRIPACSKLLLPGVRFPHKMLHEQL